MEKKLTAIVDNYTDETEKNTDTNLCSCESDVAKNMCSLEDNATIGSGVKNLNKYTPIYSGGGKPEIYEADVFRIAIPLTQEAVKQVEMGIELTEREQLVYDMICENQKISVDDIAARLDVTRRTILRDVQEIKKKVFLAYDKKESVWKLK